MAVTIDMRFAEVKDSVVTMVYESNSGPVGDAVDITGRTDIAVGWVFSDNIFSPPLEEKRKQRLEQLRAYAEEEQLSGVATSVGLTMKYGTQDCFLVDGVIRYSEMKGMPVVVKLVEVDGTEHIGTIPIADGKTILMEQFEAAYALDETVKDLENQLLAAKTLEALDQITW